MDTNFKNNNYQNYPKNCTEAPITIFGTQENRKKMVHNAEKN